MLCSNFSFLLVCILADLVLWLACHSLASLVSQNHPLPLRLCNKHYLLFLFLFLLWGLCPNIDHILHFLKNCRVPSTTFKLKWLVQKLQRCPEERNLLFGVPDPWNVRAFLLLNTLHFGKDNRGWGGERSTYFKYETPVVKNKP